VWLSEAQLAGSNVRTTQASVQPLPQFVTAGGRVAFNDNHVTHIFSPVSGRIQRLIAQPGDKVKKGTPLLAILSPDLGSAFSDLIKAQADLNAAEHDYRRQEKLLALNSAPQRDFEAAEDNFRKTRAELERAKQKAELLRNGTGSSTTVSQEYLLKSPIDGAVVARAANVGVEVQGQYSGGTAVELFTIGDIDEVWLYADLPQEEAHRVKQGEQMSVRVLAYPDRAFQGKVEWIADTLDPVLRTIRVRCSLPNPEHLLKPEMYGTVAITTEALSALAVPREAIVDINDQAFLYVEDGRRPDGQRIFKQRLVRVSEDRSRELVPVRDGLRPGEVVVIQGAISRQQPNDEAWLTAEQFNSAGIKVAVLSEQDFDESVIVGGRIAFSDNRVSHVFSPVTGRVTKVMGQPGQRMKKGDPLALILSPDVGSVVSDLAKAQADLTAAQHEYRRQKELYEAHASAQRDYEAAEDNFQKAQAELERAQEKSRLFRTSDVDVHTQEYLLRSPIDGLVVARNVNPGLEIQGQYSGASNPVELFTVGELDELWLLGDVYETDLPSIRPGARVKVSLADYPGTVFEGKVDWVADVMDPAMRTVKVRCTLQNPERILRPEMYEAVAISAPRKHGLAVPREAVLRVGDEQYVFVAQGANPQGKLIFRQRRVTVNGETTGSLLPVVSGLKAGESVAVDNSIFLLGLL
jgi:cobalt-zinc-cadmium efflux system membrane fusion protein